MGILNITPDSFSKDGLMREKDILLKAEKIIREEADIIDIGGESSRPGAKPVPLEEEIKRVIPILKEIKKRSNIKISVDTRKAQVAEMALAEGADIINDISALKDKKMLKTLKENPKAFIVIMHMQGEPEYMQDNPSYKDARKEVYAFLEKKIKYLVSSGIKKEKIILDPGIGFGKRYEDNLILIKHLKDFKALKCPILIGASRKSFIGKALNLPVEERLEGTLAVLVLSIVNGANILRAHDIKESKRAIKMTEEILKA
ncbi:MAG: dihydropteroate synthase [Armatimonadetes bacterium]|nr:dihydropteroate synthase [Armatimonadota bacterium]